MTIEHTGPEFGKALDAALIQRGLLELNPDFHFDLACATGQWHPRIATRQGVYYQGRHICSMDRGMVPEFKLWDVREVYTEVPWYEADKEDAAISWQVIFPDHEGYRDLYERGKRGNDPEYALRTDGHLVRRAVKRMVKVRGQCFRVGWRHTFERILSRGIPGVTRESLGAKFGIDMMKFPVGSPDELVAALVEE